MSESKLILSDCREAMSKMESNSVDAIVTDPPYGLAFMGVAWDTFGGRNGSPRTDATFDQVGGNHHPTCAADQARTRKSENAKFQKSMVPIFAEALRVAKPGAHLLAFGGTRTYHRLACAIEDAGWEIRDCCFWCYGSGFPKSMDVSKAIDKAMGAERTIVGYASNGVGSPSTKLNHGHGDRTGHANGDGKTFAITTPATPESAAWSGWGTCLKPACEPIVIARKPLEGTVAANVLKYGTGAINIDGCRVPTGKEEDLNGGAYRCKEIHGRDDGWGMKQGGEGTYKQPLGRFPANLIHDDSDEVLALFPESKGQCGAVKGTEPSAITNGIYGNYANRFAAPIRGDTGSAARFFYCAKASRSERGEGNDHVTVKPLALMRYLVRLVTRKGGIVLDPFMGSGTTGIAAIQEGMNFVGIEKDEHYFEIAQSRISAARPATPPPQAPAQMEMSFN